MDNPFLALPSYSLPSLFEGDDSDEDERGEIGVCMWGSGAYGYSGTVHVVDGEECCTFG